MSLVLEQSRAEAESRNAAREAEERQIMEQINANELEEMERHQNGVKNKNIYYQIEIGLEDDQLREALEKSMADVRAYDSPSDAVDSDSGKYIFGNKKKHFHFRTAQRDSRKVYA